MNELKTLKEMECKRFGTCTESPSGCEDCGSKQFYEEDLRQEVIKWIKEDAEEYRSYLGDIVKGKQIKSYTAGLIDKWKKRFNITEEDLK